VSWYHPSTVLDRVFEGGLVLKGVSGVAEFLGGLLLLLTSPGAIHGFLVFLTQKEISEDPTDKIATFLLDSTAHIDTGAKAFAVAYLWVHAAIKLTAVIGILRNKAWAYPFSLIALGALTAYQVVSLVVRFSVGMFALTVFDVFILFLIRREYAKVRHPVVEAA
jgi:uncharacterized membrane protein